jgi:Protein of unknown function, DUF481
MKCQFAVFYFCFFLAATLSAREKSDVIIMKNGDRITCEIKGLNAGTLYVSVDYILSTSSVDWSKVDHVESQQLFIVKTQNGIVYSGTLSTPTTPGERPIMIKIMEPRRDNAVVLDKTQIIQMDETATNFWQRLYGNVGLGVIYNKGNQSTQYNLGSAVSYPRERWSTSASYNSTLSSSSGTNPATRNEVNLNFEHLLQYDNWYATGLADFLQSSEQGIQLQSSVGAAIGRYVQNNNHAVISVFAGLAWQRINYQETIVPSRTQNVASALIGGDFKIFSFNKTSLSISPTFLPALSEPGRVHFNLNTSYYVKLWSNLTWNISLYGNWDNRPPPGFATSDYGTSSGLSWTFGTH